MPVKTEAVGKRVSGDQLRGRLEKIREYANAVGEADPVHHDREDAQAAGSATSSRRRCSRSSTARRRDGPGDLRPRRRDRLRDDGPRRRRSSSGASRSARATPSRPTSSSTDYLREGTARASSSSSRSPPTRTATRSCAAPGPTSCEEGEDWRSERGRPDPRAAGHARQVPAAPLRGRVGRLQPDPHRPRVRAGRSACRRTSCTGSTRWRRSRAAQTGGRRRPGALKRLAVQFRGMGFPEQEIVVTGTVTEAATAASWSRPGRRRASNRIIRNAEAELEIG